MGIVEWWDDTKRGHTEVGDQKVANQKSEGGSQKDRSEKLGSRHSEKLGR